MMSGTRGEEHVRADDAEYRRDREGRVAQKVGDIQRTRER